MNKTMTKPLDSSTAIDLTAIEAELRPQTSETLKLRFFECYSGAAKLIATASICVKLLKERGDNLSGIPMVGTFVRIASGQILAELAWQFIESPNRQVVERLPLDDQKRLVFDPMVVVAEVKPEGGFTKRKVDLRTAPPSVAKLVAGPDGLRSLEEQMAHIGAERARPVVKKEEDEQEVIQEPFKHIVGVRLTESEHEALRVRAALSRCSERDVARRFLLQSGALRKPAKV